MNNSDKITYHIPSTTYAAHATESELASQLEINQIADRRQGELDGKERMNEFIDNPEDEFDSEISRLTSAAYLEAIAHDVPAEATSADRPVFEATSTSDAQNNETWQRLGESAAHGNEIKTTEEAGYVEDARRYAVSAKAEPTLERFTLNVADLLWMGGNIDVTRKGAIANGIMSGRTKGDLGLAA